MLVNFVTKENVISYPECMAQFYFFCVFAVAECYMLSVMAYECYVAISKPLLYNVTMSFEVCLWMIAGVYAELIVVPGNELYKVVIESNASPSIKGGRVGVTVKVAGDNLVLKSSSECPSVGPRMPASPTS
ncbi:hypothetical protein U0070_002249 [Myodes glareolus]|uniref:Uncharacterized protein n=1 Tax=Myodes glareolus TaxID=447135 RepID=A0AAW0IA73_MYOGA